MSKVKIIAWNVNSIRSLIKKDKILDGYDKKFNLNDFLKKEKPDIFCMSETKLSCPDILERKNLEKEISGYKYRYYNTCIRKKGYSGTAIYSNKEPLKVIEGIGKKEHDQEGRVITLEFEKYFLLHVYTPNSGQKLERLEYRTQEWDPAFSKFIGKLQKEKPVIVCGDLNCAAYEIDLHSPKTNLKSAGFTPEERESFNGYIKKLKLIDTYRHLYPDKIEYSYWTYLRQARKNNKGWRIDYFLISDKLKSKLKESKIHTNIMGSDHAPIELELK